MSNRDYNAFTIFQTKIKTTLARVLIADQESHPLVNKAMIDSFVDFDIPQFKLECFSLNS